MDTKKIQETIRVIDCLQRTISALEEGSESAVIGKFTGDFSSLDMRDALDISDACLAQIVALEDAIVNELNRRIVAHERDLRALISGGEPQS